MTHTHTHTHIQTKNQDGHTALIGASSAGHVEVVQELIKAGANVEAKDVRIFMMSVIS